MSNINNLELKNFTMQYFSTQNRRVSFSRAYRKKEAHTALDSVSFSVSEGERVGIVGDSGSGKTSLLKAIQYFEAHDKSYIDYSGTLIKPSAQINSIMQEPKAILNPRKTVFQMFKTLHYSTVYPHSAPLSTSEIVRYLSDAQMTDILNVLRKRPHQISGGMAQKVVVGLMFAMDTKWLLADELSSSLDLETETQLMDMLLSRIDTLLLVTHRLHLLKAYCSRVLFLEEGKVYYDGSVDEFFLSRDKTIVQFIEHVNLG